VGRADQTRQSRRRRAADGQAIDTTAAGDRRRRRLSGPAAPRRVDRNDDASRPPCRPRRHRGHCPW
jgi:hypothetical protein